ncbi:MAG: hypothetical protein F6J92_15995 [Symploca sp. SIO1A3]|nr:hypothetical protein [Symploca sp. SIO1A3]
MSEKRCGGVRKLRKLRELRKLGELRKLEDKRELIAIGYKAQEIPPKISFTHPRRRSPNKVFSCSLFPIPCFLLSCK